MSKAISARQAMSDFRFLPSEEFWARAKQKRFEVIAIIPLVKGYSNYRLA